MQRTAMGYGLETERLVHSAGGRTNTHRLELAVVPAVKAQIKKDYFEAHIVGLVHGIHTPVVIRPFREFVQVTTE